jgi:hypothetical protein
MLLFERARKAFAGGLTEPRAQNHLFPTSPSADTLDAFARRVRWKQERLKGRA